MGKRRVTSGLLNMLCLPKFHWPKSRDRWYFAHKAGGGGGRFIEIYVDL